MQLQTGVLAGTRYGIDSSGLGSQVSDGHTGSIPVFYMIFMEVVRSLSSCFQIDTFAGKMVLSLRSLL